MAGEIGVDPRHIEWEPGQRPGIFRKMLRGNRDGEYTTLLKLDPGIRFPQHRHPSGEELFVVDGRIQIDGRWYGSGCYVYTPPGATHDVYSDTGAVMLIRMPGPAEVLEPWGALADTAGVRHGGRAEVSAMSMYHEGQRELQDRYRGRAVADRLEQHRMHRTFTEADRAFIETSRFFFLATAWGDSVDCSMKGGVPGFVRVTAPNEIAWPDYDGNRMYRSLGNLIKNPAVGLLFVRFDARSTRLRITGRASLDESPDAIADLPGAKRLIRVTVEYIFYNCPRYIPRMEFVEESVYSPRCDYTPPEPEWKGRDYIRDVLNEP